jgi:hypothetical protein
VTEPDVTPEEELEAAALRAALEEGRAGEHLPGDALETASFLRFGTSEGELSEARSATLRAELMTSLPARAARVRQPRIVIWLAALGGVGALAALLFTLKQPPADPHAALSAPAAAPMQPLEPSPVAALAAAPEAEAERGLAEPSDEAALRERATLPRRMVRQAPAAELEDGSSSDDAFAEPPAIARNDAVEAQARGSSGARAKRASESAGPATGALALGRAGGAAASAPAAALTPQIAAAKPGAPAATATSTRVQLERARARARRQLDARVAVRTAPSDAAKGSAQGAGGAALLAELEATRAANVDASDRRSLQQDLYWRLAELALRQGQPQQALDWARQGIALAGPPSPFLGLLWQAQGEAQQALGDREGAARSYFEAQSISEALLREDLEQ